MDAYWHGPTYTFGLHELQEERVPALLWPLPSLSLPRAYLSSKLHLRIERFRPPIDISYSNAIRRFGRLASSTNASIRLRKILEASQSP